MKDKIIAEVKKVFPYSSFSDQDNVIIIRHNGYPYCYDASKFFSCHVPTNKTDEFIEAVIDEVLRAFCTEIIRR
tara:strand:+ start:154 stop:375 length:222 start_codon:yes stop_codon:yes gene_type:complete